MTKICIPKPTGLSRKIKWLDHLTAKGPTPLFAGTLVYFVVVTLFISKFCMW